MKIAVLSLTLLATPLGASVTSAQAPPPAPKARPDCSAPEHRQFDFWLGTWNVTAGGKPAGTNRIESVMNGAAWSSTGARRAAATAPA